MKLLLFALFLPLSSLAQPATNPPSPPFPFAVSSLATNRYTNLLAVLRVSPLDTPCAECGAPNHHERRIESVETFEVVSATIVAGGQTNTFAIYQGAKTGAVVTNVYLRAAPANAAVPLPYSVRRQPGQTAPIPPLP